ncbi:MAG: peptidoglycan-binding protein [Thiohalocapsa sp.]|nr:peptidoglycan-binding protein [Thiohalocapsa sp.]
MELQQHLNALGYELAEDGHLGATTAIAVMRFQRAAGLVVDGTVGPATATALARELQSRDFAVAS